MVKRIGIIGHFGGDKNFTDGQTVKTKEINKQIEKKYNIKTMKFDTYKNSHNPIKLINGIFKIIKNNDIVILIVSQRGYKIVSVILIILNFFFKKELYDFVIGGTRYEIYNHSVFYKKIASRFNMIYVETQSMKKEYEKRGITNAVVFPNFKDIMIQSSNKINKDCFKLCTFSRVIKEKGILDAIEATKLANKEVGSNLFHLDIYGPIEKSFEEELKKAISTSAEFVEYKGIIDSDIASNIIKEYDLMLFLTFWPSEGFPGTIIDSFSSGVPVIATDWNCNFEIIIENYTGFKVNIHSPKEVSLILIDCINNRDKIRKMKKNCLNEAQKYLPAKVMQIFYNEIDK